jgi:hypothetical protein
MSNEYKDYINDLRAIFDKKMHEVDLLYDGWCNSFVPAMMDEMFAVLGSYVEDFEVYQIKEKYGALTIYKGWQDREYDEEEFKDLDNITAELDVIIEKYRRVSERTCVQCGGKATFFSSHWVIPWCDDCRDRKLGVFGIIGGDD